ncbi:DUF695 domain-containing protein [Chishuiella sp.]|uniref:DUF695 domain-containing protein n=1 Tax=Chishuiella sp. TaxID=1969467 RepID=UPI0028A5DB99|nr:DUF695 domain-containing protein [Chishuiella sp.]
MNFIKKISSNNKKDQNLQTNFWNWFLQNSQKFWEIVNTGERIEIDFFDKLSNELEKINNEIYYLSGMYDETTAELILTADGIIKNIVFVEELINKSPNISNWKFTALKPQLDIQNALIEYGDKYIFSSDNLHFSPKFHQDYPDEIDILVQYDFYDKNDEDAIINGVYIFLENYLGELSAVTTIDNLSVQGKLDDDAEIIPISKLKEYLVWRESEFSQKFQSTRRINTNEDSYSNFEAQSKNGLPYLAIVNNSILEWKGSPSHPWIMRIDIKYDGTENNGLPNNIDYNLMDDFEDEIMSFLLDKDGYLNVGRETGDNLRQIFFACHEFRFSSKTVYEIIEEYADKLSINYTIYKDKYWQTFNKFRTR